MRDGARIMGRYTFEMPLSERVICRNFFMAQGKAIATGITRPSTSKCGKGKEEDVSHKITPSLNGL